MSLFLSSTLSSVLGIMLKLTSSKLSQSKFSNPPNLSSQHQLRIDLRNFDILPTFCKKKLEKPENFVVGFLSTSGLVIGKGAI